MMMNYSDPYSDPYGELGDTFAVENGFFDFLKPKSAEAAGKPVLSRGSSGADVKELQSLLGIGADGIFGSGTEAKVKSFQMSKGLPATGIVDQATWTVLLGGKAPKSALTPEAQAAKQAKTAATISTAGSAITGLISQFGPKQPEMLSQPTYPEPEPAGFPWGWVVGGVVLVGAIGVGIYMVTKD
jgi:hypothetical protein